MTDCANDVLVETEWLATHLDDESIRIVAVDENPDLYATEHIPRAIGFDYKQDLQDPVKRDFLGPDEFGALDRVLLVNGPREKWITEGRPEFSGELISPAGYEQEGARRGGRIPGTASIRWPQAVAAEGTFKSRHELVPHELFGSDDVKNYDGSWTEWGNPVGMPIDKDV